MGMKTVIMFPYGGYQSGTDREEVFWKIINKCQEVDEKPLVILNRDTERRGQARSFLADSRRKRVETCSVWSVDSCQMWLAGWGHILDKFKKVSRIIQLPGDIDSLDDERLFYAGLEAFIRQAPGDRPLVIGDFETGDRFNAKELIDTYGTYPLLANWFPEISRWIQSLPLSKPRSEFLNIDVTVLSKMLEYRKFAYEQTLNMLIRCWDFTGATPELKHRVSRMPIGTIQDDKTFRRYRDCLDQIERTERLLKLLWREIYEPSEKAGEAKYKEFTAEYDMLDRISTNIRETARRTIRTLLGA